ncbi:hypothetical protein [Cochlodiniinecator piscidefendens]|uniref:hypothetical protein n=1 Tax=Cochlodiniinecator piscidefendens TaxID=2715756 RepID=UPI0014089FEC|nr:hypothetical protein [Cochlodiniinecator piscidefendens]
MRLRGLVFVMLLSGCFNRAADLPLLSETDVEVDAPTAELAASETEPPSLFGRLFGRDDVAEEEQDQPVPQNEQTEDSTPEENADVSEAVEEPARRGGLFGFFRRNAAPIAIETEAEAQSETVTEPDVPELQEEVVTETTEDSELSIEPAEPSDAEDAAEVETPRRGLAALFAPRASMAPNPMDEPNAGLEFGTVGRVCAVRGAELGQEVDRYPDARRGYRLFDTNPGSLEPRVFHITGFEDGCARRVTGAIALLGSPAVHEAVRYSQAQSTVPYSVVDEAYENVRRATCRARRGLPCPDARMAGLQRSTGFLHLYGHFGQSDRWMEVLLSDGDVVAYGVVTR